MLSSLFYLYIIFLFWQNFFGAEEIHLICDMSATCQATAHQTETCLFSFLFQRRKKKKAILPVEYFLNYYFFTCKAITWQTGYKRACSVCHNQMGPNVFLVQLY